MSHLQHSTPQESWERLKPLQELEARVAKAIQLSTRVQTSEKRIEELERIVEQLRGPPTEAINE